MDYDIVFRLADIYNYLHDISLAVNFPLSPGIIDEKYMKLLRLVMQLTWLMYSPDFRQDDIPTLQDLVNAHA